MSKYEQKKMRAKKEARLQIYLLKKKELKNIFFSVYYKEKGNEMFCRSLVCKNMQPLSPGLELLFKQVLPIMLLDTYLL